MILKKTNYASAVSFLAALAILLVTLFDYTRVAPSLLNSYLITKSVFFFINIGFGIYFHRHIVTDKSATIFVLNLMIFVLSMMWFLPLYEIAYFQCAIGSAFLRFKRPWIFPTVFFATFVGVIVTYQLQDNWHWVLPEITRTDWVFTVFLFFVLAWCIQKFAIRAQALERDRLLRFSIIGQETTRLTHDLKGLLSSPLLILESFKNKDPQSSPEFQERQMSLLIHDMDNVRETIKGIHSLVVHQDKIEQVDLNEVIQSSMKVLERRLASIDIQWPQESFVLAKRDRLHSVFFNLFLNSLEAFERSGIRENKKIEIFWRNKTLVFQDNAGGILLGDRASSKGIGSGLGLELVQYDLVRMNARFKLKSTPPYTVAEISFGE
jgi:signal transduction histidine kinase